MKRVLLKKLFNDKNAQSRELVVGAIAVFLGVLLVIYILTRPNYNKQLLKHVAPLLLFFSRERLRRFLC